MAGFHPGAVPANGYQVITPIVHDIQPGGSYEYCTWTDVVLEQDIDVRATQGIQSVSGHHTVLYYTKVLQPAGLQRICQDADMATFRFGLAAGGEGTSAVDTLPGNLAVHIPKGSQLVVNHHYLNPTAQVIAEAQSSMNVFVANPGEHVVRASSLAFTDTSMVVPTGQASVDVTCTINRSFATWYFIPHMHAWGKHVTVDHITASGTKSLFDVQWFPEYAFHPPQMREDPSQPYMLTPGDQLHLHCDYDNTTGKALPFGTEMCVAFAQTVDPTDVGNMACDRGKWGPF
jgi:hypothetical protein